MGVIFRGVDLTTGEPVAIKVLQKERSRERFIREAQVLTELEHPAIVGYIAHGRDVDGAPYLVEEWIEGETLSERLDTQGLDMGEAVRLVHRLAGALATTHDAGVVHRDVKPSNILLPEGSLERATLIDFGIARHVVEAERITATGVAVGTPGYMSPEQVRGARVDARSDVFALGCVLYECLSGVPVFAGIEPLAVLTKIALMPAPSIRERCEEVPEALAAVLMSLLDKDPQRRPGSGKEVSANLKPFLGLEGTIRRPTRLREARTRPLGAGRGWVWMVAAIPSTEHGSVELAEQLTMTTNARVCRLEDQSLVVGLTTQTSTGPEAMRAVSCAREIRSAMPDADIVLVSRPSTTDAWDQAIEAAVHAVGSAQMSLALHDAEGPPAIRLDERAAAILESVTEVRRDRIGAYLPMSEAG